VSVAVPAISPVIYSVAAFLLGSLPFSVWVGRIWLGADIRTFGDHNPGATNVLRAGGKAPAIRALALDAFKAAIPTGIAWLCLG
jgi:acyl phosphate:glycerol-3-phosphate acyltransferase